MKIILTLAAVAAITWPVTTHEPAAATSDAAVYIGQADELKPTPDEARAYVIDRATRAGFERRQLRCLLNLLHKESRFDVEADSPESSAYGLFQQLKLEPGTPMHDQVRLGFKYLEHRYASACDAWAHSQRHGWY